MEDKKRVSVYYPIGVLVEMKPSTMRGILFLWVMHIAGVTSMKVMPYKIWESSTPISGRPQTRLYGETEAKQGEYSFMVFVVSLVQDKRLSQCSASLLALDWVLTAAHCIQPYIRPQDVIIVGGKVDVYDYVRERSIMNWNNTVNEGKLGVEERRPQTLYVHPSYFISEEGLLHDVALIKLQKPFTDPGITTIPLSLDKIYTKKICTILGWGMTLFGNSYKLNVVREKEISTTSIGCKYETHKPLICLRADGLSGICSGDSGSPLVCEGKVWGVASFMRTNGDGCGDSLEEYYTELSAEKDWIESVLNTGSRSTGINFIPSFMLAFAPLWISRNLLD